eukprot:7388218-Prymnesium_polylepis.1
MEGMELPRAQLYQIPQTQQAMSRRWPPVGPDGPRLGACPPNPSVTSSASRLAAPPAVAANLLELLRCPARTNHAGSSSSSCPARATSHSPAASCNPSAA